MTRRCIAWCRLGACRRELALGLVRAATGSGAQGDGPCLHGLFIETGGIAGIEFAYDKAGIN
jgi:hypothetical protein